MTGVVDSDNQRLPLAGGKTRPAKPNGLLLRFSPEHLEEA